MEYGGESESESDSEWVWPDVGYPVVCGWGGLGVYKHEVNIIIIHAYRVTRNYNY